MLIISPAIYLYRPKLNILQNKSDKSNVDKCDNFPHQHTHTHTHIYMNMNMLTNKYTHLPPRHEFIHTFILYVCVCV